MTGLLAVLGLLFTGFNLVTYVPGVNVDTGSDEYQRNYIEVQRQIIVEDFFTFATALGKYNYARGCAGGYGPDKRANCGKKSFDCGGVIKAYGFIKGILTRQEVGRNNSKTLYDFGQPISPYVAQRGDYTYRELVSGSGLANTHGAFVSEQLSGGTITIFDGLGGKFDERELRLLCNENWCIYNTANGKYKIKFSTNPLYELAMQRGIEVQPFASSGDIQQDTGTQYKMCIINPNNPLGFYITIDGYAYDSEANRIANRWYVRNKDKDMIATFICENGGFNPKRKSHTNDYGLCQLNYIYNKDFINSTGWNDIEFQKQVCLDKWNNATNKNIWVCYAKRKYYLKKIKDIEGGFWSLYDI